MQPVQDAAQIGAVGSAPPSSRFSAGYSSVSSAFSCGQTSRVSMSYTWRTCFIAPGASRASAAARTWSMSARMAWCSVRNRLVSAVLPWRSRRRRAQVRGRR
jgi:hypothetical protein